MPAGVVSLCVHSVLRLEENELANAAEMPLPESLGNFTDMRSARECGCRLRRTAGVLTTLRAAVVPGCFGFTTT